MKAAPSRTSSLNVPVIVKAASSTVALVMEPAMVIGADAVPDLIISAPAPSRTVTVRNALATDASTARSSGASRAQSSMKNVCAKLGDRKAMVPRDRRCGRNGVDRVRGARRRHDRVRSCRAGREHGGYKHQPDNASGQARMNSNDVAVLGSPHHSGPQRLKIRVRNFRLGHKLRAR